MTWQIRNVEKDFNNKTFTTLKNVKNYLLLNKGWSNIKTKRYSAGHYEISTTTNNYVDTVWVIKKIVEGK